MKGRTAERWVEAGQWLERAKGVPAIVAQEVRKRAQKALKRAIPAKPKVRLPRGTKTPQKEKKELHGECEALCKALVFHRDCGDWRAREGACITCGHWRALQWGHFIERQKAPALRYSVRATAGQCGYCNGYGKGEAIKFAAAIDKRDGAGTAAHFLGYEGKRHVWNKKTLSFALVGLAADCRAKGIDPAAVLADWKGPKTSPGAQRPEPASGEGPNVRTSNPQSSDPEPHPSNP